MSTALWIIAILTAFIAVALAVIALAWGLRAKRGFEETLQHRADQVKMLEEQLQGARGEIDRLNTDVDYWRHRVELGKGNIPSFGGPELKRYNPMEFPEPLVCATCDTALVVDEYYYEIPIMNAGPRAVTAVHLRCERAVPIG